MPADALRAIVAADFNAAGLAGYLSADPSPPGISAVAGRLDEPPRTEHGGPGAGAPADLVLVWTRPDAVCQSFKDLVETGAARLDDVLAEVDEFAARMAAWRDRTARLAIVTWTTPRMARAFPSLGMKHGEGLANVVMRMNLRLAERVAEWSDVTLLDSQPWMNGHDAADARFWYAAKVPFGHEVFRRAAKDVKSLVAASAGLSRKLIVLDLDGTLWGGILGDVGWERLRLGGHDPLGEAFADFQAVLRRLARRGVLLGIVSKNDEESVLQAFARHPEMVLGPGDFGGWRINWEDKAQNVRELAQQLNLGLGSVVFIDDHPAERARVREALPEVLVPEWPASPLLYVDALLDLRCFDTLDLTAEDRLRGQLYAAEAARRAGQEAVGSFDEWLGRLALRVEAEALNDRNRPRAVQLLNKTSQMNLATRRLTASELERWLLGGRRQMWTFRVSDRFGDAGLTGLASVEVRQAEAELVDFVLSCRVLGRRVEETILHHVITEAQLAGAARFRAVLRPTPRNGPCLRFLRSSGLAERDGAFSWDLTRGLYPCPEGVELRREAVVSAPVSS